MGEVEVSTPAGWYDDGQGQVRWWDGSAWTEHVQGPKSSQGLKSSALKRIGASIKKAVDDRAAAKRQQYAEEMARQTAAGRLLTKGEFGGHCVEIYEGGYVRIMSRSESSPEARTRRNASSRVKQAPYERLISVAFVEGQTDPSAHDSRATTAPKTTAVQTFSGLIGGGIKALPLGAVAAAVGAGASHVIKAKSGKSTLTITTDMNIHALTNEGQNSMGITVVLRDQVPIGRALERAALIALGLPLPQERAQIEAHVQSESHPDSPGSPTQQQASSVTDRLRELATLHREGLINETEFAIAKANLLGNM